MPGCHVQPEQFFNLIFGYNAAYGWYVNTTSGGAPDRWVYATAVPAGEVWVVTNATANNASRSPTSVQIYIKRGSDYYGIRDDQSPAVGAMTLAQGWFVMAQGDQLAIRYRGVQAGDSTYESALGFKMKAVQ